MSLVDYASSSEDEESEEEQVGAVKEQGNSNSEMQNDAGSHPPMDGSSLLPAATAPSFSIPRQTYTQQVVSSSGRYPESYSHQSEPSELKLPDASLLLNSPAMPSHLAHASDHSSRVAAAVAESAARKRDSNPSASSYPRSKIPKGNFPPVRSVPDTGGGLLLPPQLSGRSNIVTEDIGKLFVKKQADSSLH